MVHTRTRTYAHPCHRSRHEGITLASAPPDARASETRRRVRAREPRQPSAAAPLRPLRRRPRARPGTRPPPRRKTKAAGPLHRLLLRRLLLRRLLLLQLPSADHSLRANKKPDHPMKDGPRPNGQGEARGRPPDLSGRCAAGLCPAPFRAVPRLCLATAREALWRALDLLRPIVRSAVRGRDATRARRNQ
jgi:hypothetical protein